MRTLAWWVSALLVVAICSTAAGLLLGAWHQPRGYRWGKVVTPPLPAPPLARSHAHRDAEAFSIPDLYGNPITPAVATYGFDAFGAAVEEHYPGTRVMPLRAPQG